MSDFLQNKPDNNPAVLWRQLQTPVKAVSGCTPKSQESDQVFIATVDRVRPLPLKPEQALDMCVCVDREGSVWRTQWACLSFFFLTQCVFVSPWRCVGEKNLSVCWTERKREEGKMSGWEFFLSQTSVHFCSSDLYLCSVFFYYYYYCKLRLNFSFCFISSQKVGC